MSIKTLQNFYKETVTRRWTTTGAGNFYVSVKPVPTSGWLVINPANATLREIVKYSNIGTDGNGDYITVAAAADRGLGGTTAQTHEIGESIRLNFTAQHQQEISDAIDTKPSISSGTTAPATTPGKVGDIFVDTTAHKVYIADGTTNSGNWLILN
jgi:hypothetical protein